MVMVDNFALQSFIFIGLIKIIIIILLYKYFYSVEQEYGASE